MKRKIRKRQNIDNQYANTIFMKPTLKNEEKAIGDIIFQFIDPNEH